MNKKTESISVAPQIKVINDFVKMNISKLQATGYVGEYALMPDLVNIGKINDKRIIFSPLLSKLYAIKEELYNKIISGEVYPHLNDLINANLLVPKGINFDLPRFSPFILVCVNSICNLGCIYCAYGHNKGNREIELDFVKSVVDYTLEKNPKDTLTIGFSGYGEPTQAIDKIKKIHDYVVSKTGKHVFTITTNGVFPEKVADWLIDNIDLINISCDGPPHIQNIQRPTKGKKPSSPIVEKNIKKFLENGKDVKVASTMTKFSIDKQKEILNYFHSLGVKFISFANQLTSDWTKPQILSYEDILRCHENALSTIEIAEDYGICLKYGVFFMNPLYLGCKKAGREIDLLPGGDVVFCGLMKKYLLETNNPVELNKIGFYDRKDKKLVMNESIIENYAKRNVFSIPGCRSCPAKWLCGSGCPIGSLKNYGDFYKPGNPRNFCELTISYMKKYLTFKAEKHFIKIKPCIEKRNDILYFKMFFNEFKLNLVKNNHDISENCLIEIDELCDMQNLSQKIIKETGRRKYNPPLFLLSFNFSSKYFKENINSILNFLSLLKKSKVYFKVTKPFPRCLFDSRYPEFIKEFSIPRTCFECLQLFVVEGDKIKMCNGRKYFLKEFKDRNEIYEKFRTDKNPVDKKCRLCLYHLREECTGACQK